jgi:peptide/nickel transport system substrate-binding protein
MRKKFYNIICLLFCFALCGCTNEISNPAKINQGSTSSIAALKYSKNTINLPYALNKSINPFTANSMLNLMLSPLMFDSLCKPDESFKPVNILAASVTSNGNTVICKLVNAKFTDGSQVTANDVQYSYTLATNQGPAGYFYSRVANIASITTQKNDTVIFTLKAPDLLFSNLLDIPIIKADSDKLPQTQLIGSGRYIYKKNGNNATLVYNKNWFHKASPQITTIQLIDMPDDTTIASSIEIGSIDYVLSDYGTGTPMSISLGSNSINLNQIVYIGINSINPINSALTDPHVRKAISLIINRKEIVKDVYSSHAIATVLPFNPSWDIAPKVADIDLVAEVDKAKSELALAGYNTKNSAGVFTKTEGGVTSTLDFTILVNKDANLRVTAAEKIANYLKNAGFNINVNEVDFASYTASIQTSAFDMYFGELKLTNNMNLSPFFVVGSAASFGIAPNSSFYTALTAYENNTAKLVDAATAFNNDTPFIPICYKIGAVSFPRTFFKNIVATNHDIFYNIEDWK